MLKAGQQTPTIMLQLGVQTRARLLTANTEVSEVVPKLLLMGRTEAAPDPSPQHQPIDLGLKLSWERQSHLINPARLDDSKAVLRISKPWPQQIAKQVQPTNLVSRTQLSPVCHLQKHIAEDPHRRDGP